MTLVLVWIIFAVFRLDVCILFARGVEFRWNWWMKSFPVFRIIRIFRSVYFIYTFPCPFRLKWFSGMLLTFLFRFSVNGWCVSVCNNNIKGDFCMVVWWQSSGCSLNWRCFRWWKYNFFSGFCFIVLFIWWSDEGMNLLNFIENSLHSLTFQIVCLYLFRCDFHNLK